MSNAVSSAFITGDIGDTEVKIVLNVNEITFIIAGLRDLATDLRKAAEKYLVGDEDRDSTMSDAEDNELLANKLENAYLSQLV